MCLTGAFAIPLILERCVVAPVAARPGVPFSAAFLAVGIGRGQSPGTNPTSLCRTGRIPGLATVVKEAGACQMLYHLAVLPPPSGRGGQGKAQDQSGVGEEEQP